MGNAFHKVVEILAGIEKQGRTPTYKDALDTLEQTWNSNAYLKKPKKNPGKKDGHTWHIITNYTM